MFYMTGMLPVASPDKEHEPGQAVPGYPPARDHAQVLEHPQHRHHGVRVGDGPGAEGELVKVWKQAFHRLQRTGHKL